MLLADSREEEYNLKHAFAHIFQGGTSTVRRILTFVTCMIRFCLRPLHNRFVAWTKPNTASLMLGTLTDLAKSKSELVAENARLALASSRFQALLEIQVEGSFSPAKDLPGHRGLDQADGEGQPTLGSRAD